MSEIKAEAEELQRVRELRAVGTLILALVAIAEAANAAAACVCDEERCEAVEEFCAARKALEDL